MSHHSKEARGDPRDAVLDDFEIAEMLGEGGSATVHRALHKTLGLPVALKRWRARLTADQARKFREECRLQWHLSKQHPNIVGLHWVGTPAGQSPWLAMELFECSLADRLASDPPLSVDDRLDISEDFLRGLAAIHANAHVHRDVKPANVLLKDGHAALGDLGIAMHIGGWTVHEAAGTTHYVAPELRPGHPPDYRSDVYSAGRTIETAFKSDIPSWLVPLITRATSYEPSDRPADAREFLDRLRHARSYARGGALNSRLESTSVSRAAPVVRTAPLEQYPALLHARTRRSPVRLMATLGLAVTIAVAIAMITSEWPWSDLQPSTPSSPTTPAIAITGTPSSQPQPPHATTPAPFFAVRRLAADSYKEF